MAKTIKIKVSYGITKNLGNYESLRLEYTAESEISSGESPTEMMHKTRKVLRNHIDIGIADEVAYLQGR